MILISFINFILNIFKRCNYTVWAKWVICHHSLLPIPSAWPSTASAAAAPCAAPARLWRSPSRCLAFLRRRRPFSPAPGLSLSFPSLHPHLATAPPLSPAAASTPGHCPHSFSTIAAHSQHSGRHSTSSATSPRAVTATPSDHQPHRTLTATPFSIPRLKNGWVYFFIDLNSNCLWDWPCLWALIWASEWEWWDPLYYLRFVREAVESYVAGGSIVHIYIHFFLFFSNRKKSSFLKDYFSYKKLN